jgi:glutamate--cysteine ligase
MDAYPMSTREAAAPSREIGSRHDLVGWIAAGEKPRQNWRIGTEHEKIVFQTGSLAPVPYEGPGGIRALMTAMMDRYGWEPILEGATLIALRRPKSELAPGAIGGSISLEPGGQFELSGAPLATLHDTYAETTQHLREVLAVGETMGIGFLGLGFSPKWALADVPHMPKQRYAVMTRYMPQVGARGLDMMYRTATIQVNLDFGSEADMVKKLQVSLALQPVATALFASSPFTECKPNGYKSMRSQVWLETDPRRTGMLPFAFEPGMGYERYVDYALDVPMYFVYRDGRYIDVAGASFRTFMDGKLPQLPGERATIDDWSDHLTTLFPEVRLKKFLEMRGADSGGGSKITALSAFWTGLLYDSGALDEAHRLIAGWTADERQGLRNDVPRLALDAPFRTGRLLDVARRVVAISASGLRARRCLNAKNQDESIYLAPLEHIATGKTLADDLLGLYGGRWNGHVDPVFQEFAY